MPNVNSNILFLSVTLRIAREHSPIKCVRDEWTRILSKATNLKKNDSLILYIIEDYHLQRK